MWESHIVVRMGATALIAATDAGENGDNSPRLTEKDRLEAIKVALAAGNDIEGEDRKGFHAMHMAANSGLRDIITFLLDKGAELNPHTKPRTVLALPISPQTPLGIAEGTLNGGRYHERPETADFLRKLGAKSEGRVTLELYMKAATASEENPAK